MHFQPGEGLSSCLLRDYEPLCGPSFQVLLHRGGSIGLNLKCIVHFRIRTYQKLHNLSHGSSDGSLQGKIGGLG